MLWNFSELSSEKFKVVTVRPGHVLLIKGVCDMSLQCQPTATVAMLRVWHGDACWKDCCASQWVGAVHGGSCCGVKCWGWGGSPSPHFRCCLCFSFWAALDVDRVNDCGTCFLKLALGLYQSTESRWCVVMCPCCVVVKIKRGECMCIGEVVWLALVILLYLENVIKMAWQLYGMVIFVVNGILEVRLRLACLGEAW